MCVSVCACSCVCLLMLCGVHICFSPMYSHFEGTLSTMPMWARWHVHVCSHVTLCLPCSPALFAPVLHVCKACYMKSEAVEPSAGASEFICIHSTACLSSEPVLITSSSGLLQHCAYSLSLAHTANWADVGTFL